VKDFFKGVRKHIGKLDANQLREQYGLVTDELANSDMIFHTMSEGILRLDETGSIVKTNPAAAKLLGMEPAEILPQLEIPLGKTSKREISLTYPDARTLELKTIPMADDTLVFIRDVSAERTRSEEESRAGATRAVRELASGVAHEIGNPLNAISLDLQLLKRDYPTNESIDECIHQVARLDGILKGFLQALKPSRPNLMAGSVAEPLTNCLAALKNQFEERAIAVTLDIPTALPQVALDRDQIEQVFFNLLKNALEAVKAGGKIDLAIGADDNDVVTTIGDSGAGIPPDQLVHLFEPYRTTKEHGTGLGLMISQRIVRDHGGTIDVESEAGKGTTFTVRLPRIEKRVRQLK